MRARTRSLKWFSNTTWFRGLRIDQVADCIGCTPGLSARAFSVWKKGRSKVHTVMAFGVDLDKVAEAGALLTSLEVGFENAAAVVGGRDDVASQTARCGALQMAAACGDAARVVLDAVGTLERLAAMWKSWYGRLGCGAG